MGFGAGGGGGGGGTENQECIMKTCEVIHKEINS